MDGQDQVIYTETPHLQGKINRLYIILAAVIALIGFTYYMYSTGRISMASGTDSIAVLEAENTTKSGPVTIVRNTSASGGSYIEFGEVLVPSLTPTTIVTNPAASPTPTRTITPPTTSTKGIWISTQEILQLPTTGTAWNALVSAANSASATGADISNQDSNHDISTLAAALVCARLNDTNMCNKARSAVVNAIDTENGGRWLAVGRNLGAYIIAADILDLRNGKHGTQGTQVQAWLERFYTKNLAHNNNGAPTTFRQSAWNSGSNASAQEGFAYTALALYLGKQEGVEWSWNAYRRYTGDRTSSHKITSNNDAWQEKPSDPVGIQNTFAKSADGINIAGAISNDMVRGNPKPVENLVWVDDSRYPWVGLEGAVPAALVFHRAGYPSFQISDQAIKRAFTYLWDVRQKTGEVNWFDGKRANELIHIVNKMYNEDFIIQYPVAGGGRTVDFTDWTH